MATETQPDIRKGKLEEVELLILQALLYNAADAINALMRDRVAYTKTVVGGQ